MLNASPLRKGRVTLARVSRDKGGFKLHVAVGESIGKSEWSKVGCPPFPGTDIVMDGNTKDFAKQLISNHYALVYGDVTTKLENFYNLLKIRYIFT